jgi:hypothetical protein
MQLPRKPPRRKKMNQSSKLHRWRRCSRMPVPYEKMAVTDFLGLKMYVTLLLFLSAIAHILYTILTNDYSLETLGMASLGQLLY